MVVTQNPTAKELTVPNAPFTASVVGVSGEQIAALEDAEALILFGLTEVEPDKPDTTKINTFGAIMANGKQLNMLMHGLGLALGREVFALDDTLAKDGRNFCDDVINSFGRGMAEAFIEHVGDSLTEELIAKRAAKKHNQDVQ